MPAQKQAPSRGHHAWRRGRWKRSSLKTHDIYMRKVVAIRMLCRRPATVSSRAPFSIEWESLTGSKAAVGASARSSVIGIEDCPKDFGGPLLALGPLWVLLL